MIDLDLFCHAFYGASFHDVFCVTCEIFWCCLIELKIWLGLVLPLVVLQLLQVLRQLQWLPHRLQLFQ